MLMWCNQFDAGDSRTKEKALALQEAQYQMTTNDTPHDKTQSRVEKVANYVIQFVAVVTSLQVGRMWVHYDWVWYLMISFGTYLAVLLAAWVLYRVVEKAWTLNKRTP